jgi:hypothetical protein
MTSVAGLSCAAYLLYVGLFWFGASTALWKGIPPELSWKMVLVLEVAPMLGIGGLNIGCSWLPTIFDHRLAYVVSRMGGFGIAASAIMLTLPIIRW